MFRAPATDTVGTCGPVICNMTSTKAKVSDLNPHIICVLCGGYLVDATTITECLHSFCRACIVRFLEVSHFCPVCDAEVHRSKPLLSLKADHILQDLVFKLVPGLITDEVKRRKEFFYQHCPADVSTPSDLLEASIHRHLTHGELFYAENEKISICLEYSDNGEAEKFTNRMDKNNNCQKIPVRRYLLCPALFTIRLLKKFIRNKFDLPLFYKMDIFHTKDPLNDEYTLMDVAYIYTWRKTAPLRLFYSAYEMKPKVSLPVHIPLPASLVRKRSPMSSSPDLGSRLRYNPHDKTTVATETDSKEGISDRIQNYMNRRSRVFKRRTRAKLPTSTTNTGTKVNNTTKSTANKDRLPFGVAIKQEVVTDDSGSTSSGAPSPILPSPPRSTSIQSLKITVPRYMVRGYPFTVRKRKYDSSSASDRSSSFSSSSGIHADRSSPESEGKNSTSTSGLELYDFRDEDEDEIEVRAPKLVRRRFSDSSWSSDF